MSKLNDASPDTAQGDAVEIDGVVERIIFSNAETGYVIADIHQEKSAPVTVKGVLPGLRCGESVHVSGRRVLHPSFGPQVEGKSFSVKMPASVEAMRKFLGSGLVAGVGKGFADKIVTKFGRDTARILGEESGRLREIPGLGPKRAALIKLAWDEQLALREVLMFLQTYGVGIRRCMRIVKEYGTRAPELLRSDPYTLARDVDGIGFKTADQIALNMGLASDSFQRIRAALVFTLGEAEGEGHTALPPEVLLGNCHALVGGDMARIEQCLATALREKIIISYDNLLQLPGTARAEEAAAKSLRVINSTPSAIPEIKLDAAIQWAEKRAGFSFAPEQAEAVAAALEYKVCVITGGPGTGKTSILRAVVDILKAKRVKILLASPTGRAAQRLAESAGMEASTLHRLLKINAHSGAEAPAEETTLDADMVIVDEVSMLDVRLAAALFRSISSGTHILLVGDADQLPSVGPGNVLADVITSGAAKVVRLKSVFRQSEGSEIVRTANRILSGENVLPDPVSLENLRKGWLPEVTFFATRVPEEAAAATVALAERWRNEGVEALDMQVLAPMHKGRTGIQALNASLQEALNPETEQRVEYMSSIAFRVGDKVICTRNNYDKSVFNGDMGIVSGINKGEGSVTISFADGEVSFARMELADLSQAYAISIHKSQGSEFDYVAIPIMPEHLVLLRRNLLYTAVTRARRGVVIIGSPDAWKMALSRKRSGDRYSTLRGRIQEQSRVGA
jgi:exodeoxyribonuclease V alpha subunit